MLKETLIKQAITQNRNYYKTFKTSYEDGILREHNQEVYEKIIKGLSKGNKVLFEQATGTGKSYLALKFLHDHAQGKRVLFVSPANAIKDSFTDLCNKWLGENYCEFDTCLYQGLKGKQSNHYDIIIFDEVHRMGAVTWGPNAEMLMNNNPNASVLGMTATLDRPDCVDVRQYFDNREPVSRITLVEALERGILPKPDYTLAKVDFEDDMEYIDTCIKDFKEKLKQAEGEEKKQILEFLERLKKAKQAIAESEDIPQIFANEITTKELKQGKFIVFCPAGEDEGENKESIHHMKTIMKQAPKWFEGVEGIKKIKKYSVYSKLDTKKNIKIIDAFERDESKALKLLFSINMLNEGLHIDDIDGVIMLRSTGSRIIYLQQLGRALSVGHKHQPKIFDFVANLNYVDVTTMQQIVTDVNKGVKNGGYGGGDIDPTENNLRFKLNIDNLDTLQLIDSLKSNIFAFNRKNDFEFEDFYNRLLTYKNEYGDCLVPNAYICKDGYPLGQKVSSIRSDNVFISNIDKQRLIDIGFIWIAKGFDSDNIRVDLKRFVEEFNQFITTNKRMPKRCDEPKTDEEKYEKSLYQKWLVYHKFENLKNNEEINYIQDNLIQLEKDTIRESVKKFVKDFVDFVIKNKREPRQTGDTEERKLYDKWTTYRKIENLKNEDEIEYLQTNGITLIEENIDGVRNVIKKFVREFNTFVLRNKKTPSKNGEIDERSLYAKWIKYRKVKNLNQNEINYLRDNGIELVEEYNDSVRKIIKQFVEDFNTFVTENKRTPKCYSKPRNNEEIYELKLYRNWYAYRQPENLNSDEMIYIQNNLKSLEKDNIREAVKQFVEEFNAFVTENKRTPNQKDLCEKRLYNKWFKYRQSKNLNEDEIRYMQEHGIKVLGLEEIQTIETLPD